MSQPPPPVASGDIVELYGGARLAPTPTPTLIAVVTRVTARNVEAIDEGGMRHLVARRQALPFYPESAAEEARAASAARYAAWARPASAARA